MKVEIRHTRQPLGNIVAIYVVRLADGKLLSFGSDYKAAHRFVAGQA